MINKLIEYLQIVLQFVLFCVAIKFRNFIDVCVCIVVDKIDIR